MIIQISVEKFSVRVKLLKINRLFSIAFDLCTGLLNSLTCFNLETGQIDGVYVKLPFEELDAQYFCKSDRVRFRVKTTSN